VPVTERDKRRLDALIAIVKPANSLAARLDSLTDDQRNWYEGWKTHCERWMRKNGERAYQRILEGYGPAGLREDIGIALFGELPRILQTDDDEKAAQIYQRHCNG
jgi:hypothetical protein